jgi:DNA-binding transcriptional ArsR family regulator
LERIGSGEARVTDLARPFPISLNSISKHIRVLEAAKLVRRRRVGREHLLSLNPVPTKSLRGLNRIGLSGMQHLIA